MPRCNVGPDMYVKEPYCSVIGYTTGRDLVVKGFFQAHRLADISPAIRAQYKRFIRDIKAPTVAQHLVIHLPFLALVEVSS